jgi:hypothetical protein
MRRYRYRTPALIGPWRASAGEAADDAIRARQATRSGPNGADLRWRLSGWIEENSDEDRGGGR